MVSVLEANDLTEMMSMVGPQALCLQCNLSNRFIERLTKCPRNAGTLQCSGWKLDLLLTLSAEQQVGPHFLMQLLQQICRSFL